VQKILFTPGAAVNEGDILVELNVEPDLAQLRALQASAELAQINYRRDKSQLAIKGVSKEVVDTDAANVKNLLAQVDQQAATIAKKIIRAPFSGRLGVSAVNPGQYLSPGDQVVTLQQLTPIYVDFFIPQQMLTELKIGQLVTVESNAEVDKKFAGKITTINPVVDTATRNVEIEATLDNLQQELVPGMFGNVIIETGKPSSYLMLPQTAISYNPYGDIVYVVNQGQVDKKNKVKITVTQKFVKTGETRGDQVAILDGLQRGDEVVTSGQLKLKNGSEVAVDNSVIPPDSAMPTLPNEH
jgi:membrane fusion protein (multidrug efflux system)